MTVRGFRMTNTNDCFSHYLPPYEDYTVLTTVNVLGVGRYVSTTEKDSYSNNPPLDKFEWRQGKTLPDFQILLLTNFCGEFESEATGTMTLQDSKLVIMFPGVWHRYRPLLATEWTERWLCFSGELAYKLFNFRFGGTRVAVTTPRDEAFIVNKFDDLLDTIHESNETDPALLSLKALRIIVESAACQQEDALAHDATPRHLNRYSRIDDPVVRKALEIIWSHSDCPMSVGDISRQLPVTRRTLDHRFTATIGHSLLEEINNCRISRAKRLLKSTDLPVKIVAHLAGFPSPERMRVTFVEREQLSPIVFRKKYSLNA